MTRLSTIALMIAALAWASVARADDMAEGKRHFDSGLALQKAEEFESAALEFEASVEAFPTKSGLFNLANCYWVLKRYNKVLATLHRLHRDFDDQLDEDMKSAAKVLEDDVRSVVAILAVIVEPKGAAILVDGEDMGTAPLSTPLLLSPGEYEVTARLEGLSFETVTVKILSGDRREVALNGVDAVVPVQDEIALSSQAGAPIEPVPTREPPKNRGQRTARAFGWVSVAFAAVAGAGCVFFYVNGSQIDDEFKDARDDYNNIGDQIENQGPTEDLINSADQAWDKMEEKKDEAKTAQNIGLAQGIGAGVFTTVAIILFVVAHKKGKNAEAPVSVSASPGGFAMEF